ncbi:LysR family transcriptional regulator [Herbaspirillum robiniae]|uniref:LysR family transcriptional regulator n=1 Tax=Herbaspirillum robiniae TaxID=2014887 RepID=UPI003D77E6B0
MIPSLNTIVGRLTGKQFRLLAALGEHHSLLNAAKEVSMSQPGASKALREIESIFGMDLFTRTNRGLEPNSAGYCVIRYARLFQTDIAHLRGELENVMEGHGGCISIGTMMGSVPLLANAIFALRKKQRNLTIKVIEDTSPTLLHFLDEGKLDMAICRTTISKNPELYTSIDIQRDNLCVIAGMQHRLADRCDISLSDLVDEQWIVYPANMPVRRLLEREFHEAGLRMPNHLVETTSSLTTISLLKKDEDYVTLLPDFLADFFEAGGLAKKLSLAIQSRSEPYELVHRAGVHITPEMNLMMKELQIQARQFTFHPDSPV